MKEYDTLNYDKMNELLCCKICPRHCSVNRYEGSGYCRSGFQVNVAKAYLHKWEEPCVSGKNGSGTVFFSNCNLNCVFCQNYKISQDGVGKSVSIDRLVEIFIELQEKGANNINLVTPTQWIPQIREAIIRAKENGLKIPFLYNSNAYENVEALKTLEGLIDIYLPDLKYYDDKYAVKYSNAPEYFKYASSAILEMLRQVGAPQFDEEGIIKKGLMIRHLMLPGLLFDSKKIVDWVISNLPKEVYFNIMCQYVPMNKACDYPEINKKINKKHYDALVDYALEHGIVNGFIQEFDSAVDDFVPDFDFSGI